MLVALPFPGARSILGHVRTILMTIVQNAFTWQQLGAPPLCIVTNIFPKIFKHSLDGSCHFSLHRDEPKNIASEYDHARTDLLSNKQMDAMSLEQ